MHPLLQKQTELQTEASQLLEETLLPLLEKYGKVIVGGSYVYNLLNHPDLDIDVVSEAVSKEIFVNLCAELILLPGTFKFKSSDRVSYRHAPATDRPVGYWLSPEIYFGNHKWNLDIWLQKPEWHTGNTSRYKEELLNIDEESRIAILSLKEELLSKKLYGIGREFVSTDIYEGVLRGNVKTVDELSQFISRNRL